jgi:DnaJ-class molecular chaperone
VQIPAGSQPGDFVRLRNQGIRRLNSGYSGDHFVHLNIQIPKYVTASAGLFGCSSFMCRTLTKDERDLVEALASIERNRRGSVNVREEMSGAQTGKSSSSSSSSSGDDKVCVCV